MQEFERHLNLKVDTISVRPDAPVCHWVGFKIAYKIIVLIL